MPPFAFLASIRGAELIGFCALIVAFMFLYLTALPAGFMGRATSLGACALAIVTAAAVVKLKRIVRARES